MSPLTFLQKIDPTPEQVLRIFDLWPTLPINVELVSEKLGLQLDLQILDKMSHNCRRFVIANAIGIYVKSTMEPNSFAVELLMPRKIISKCINLSVTQVAQLFDVAPHAAQIRLLNV